MQRTRTVRTLLMVLALALVAASCGGRDEDTSGDGGGGGGGGGGAEGIVDAGDCPDNNTAGIDEEAGTITVASSFPQADPLLKAFAQISKGWKAYFDSLNSKGGVEVAGKSYQIETIDKDDNYDETKTRENITEMLGRDGDGAFAVFNVVGTANNEAIREDLDELCVPNVFAATGSPAWGNPKFPWTIGSTLAPYTVEAQAFADHLKAENPDAKVAMLVQDDDFGQAYEEGFAQAIEGTDITVTEVKTYATGTSEVAAQVTSLAASGADTFFNGATLLACPNALGAAKDEGWEAVTFVSGTCISKTLMGLAGADADDALAVTNIKDPLNPAFADDEAMQEYLAVMEEFGADDADPENGIVAFGYTQAALFTEILKGLETLDRVSLMNAMYSIEDLKAGLLIDGSTINTSDDDRFLAENVQLIQYDATAGYFENVGETLDFEGKTTELTPPDLITAEG